MTSCSSSVAAVAPEVLVELVGLRFALAHQRLERLPEQVAALGVRSRRRLRLPGRGAGRSRPAEPEPDLGRSAGRNCQRVPGGGLRPGQTRVDGLRSAHDVVVDPVLRIGRGRRLIVDSRQVRLVLAEQQARRRPVRARPGTDLERVVAEDRVLGQDPLVADRCQHRRLVDVRVARPLVAEPEGRQDVESRLLGRPIAYDDPHQDVGRVRLGVVDLDDPVAVVVEDTGVEQLVLGFELGAPGVLLDQALRRGTAPAGSGSASAAMPRSEARRGTTSSP